MQSSPVISHLPILKKCSSTTLAEIAARVIREIQAESNSNGEDDFFEFREGGDSFINGEPLNQSQAGEVNNSGDAEEEEEDEDDDFEFPSLCREPVSSPISADHILYDGQIRTVYPIFNRDLLSDDVKFGHSNAPAPPVRISLKSLFIMERSREAPSCSSSESDELDGISPESYCVWTPMAGKDSTRRCDKSSSTGSSKRWRFRDLLRRSNSDGEASLASLSPLSAKSASQESAKTKTT